MPLTYEIDGKLQQLAPVMDEHAEWYGRVMRLAFYPEEEATIMPPDSFNEWVRSVEGEEFIDTPALDRLRAVHDEMHVRAANLLQESGAGKKPTIKTFDKYTDM
ncbi:MAG: hypothetical protein KJ667_06910, partial [Alphaproteobacteria bacterium]|nr:hypothetical protein [Alphaproteobacteria bacterium]